MKIENTQERFDTLEEASKPLLEYLRKHYNPLAIAIVKDDNVEILSSEMMMPLKLED